MAQQPPHLIVVGIEQHRGEHGLQVLRQGEVEQPVERMLALLRGEQRDAPAFEAAALGIAHHDHLHLAPVAREDAPHGDGQFVLHCLPEGRIRIQGRRARLPGGEHRHPRLQPLEHVGLAHGELELELAARDCAVHVQPLRAPVGHAHHVVPRRIRHARVVQDRGGKEGPSAAARQRLQPGGLRIRRFGHHEGPPPGFAQRRDQRMELLLGRQPRRHRHAALAVVLIGSGRGQSDRARFQPLRHERAHGGDLLRRGGASRCVRAHDPRAQGRVADVGGDIRPDPLPLEKVEVLREALETPVHAGAQAVQRHALHVRQIAQIEVAIGRPARSEGEAAVAHHRSGDAQLGRGRGQRVPGDLRVVVGMAVDDAGHQRQAVRVDALACGAEVAAHGSDATAGDGDVGVPPRGAEPIVDSGVGDQKVVHARARRSE